MTQEIKKRKQLPLRRKKANGHNGSQTMDPQEIFRDSINKISTTLVIIMITCGIHECKANNTKEILIRVFEHYEIARHQKDNTKLYIRISKKNLLRRLADKCLMTLIEAQLTYYILKFALRAFYKNVPKNNTDEEDVWTKAAKQTIFVTNKCQGILRPTVEDYKSDIMNIYQKLAEYLKKCMELHYILTTKENKKLALQISNKKKLQENLLGKHRPNSYQKELQAQNPFDIFNRCCKCKYLLELCNCGLNKNTGELALDSDQRPFKCIWFFIDKENRLKMQDHICPVDFNEKFSLLSIDKCQNYSKLL